MWKGGVCIYDILGVYKNQRWFLCTPLPNLQFWKSGPLNFFFGNIISINLSSQSNLSKSKKFQDLNLYDF